LDLDTNSSLGGGPELYDSSNLPTITNYFVLLLVGLVGIMVLLAICKFGVYVYKTHRAKPTKARAGRDAEANA
jgi:hypothetical protein